MTDPGRTYSGVEITYVKPDPHAGVQAPFFFDLSPDRVGGFTPEARQALARLHELPFAVRVLAWDPTDEAVPMETEVQEILIGLQHVMAHVRERASAQPSVVTVQVVRETHHDYPGGPLCHCSCWYTGRTPLDPSRDLNQRYHLREADCAGVHPE